MGTAKERVTAGRDGGLEGAGDGQGWGEKTGGGGQEGGGEIDEDGREGGEASEEEGEAMQERKIEGSGHHQIKEEGRMRERKLRGC